MKPILDISEFRFVTDYDLAASQISSVIIRIGGTGWTSHTQYTDRYFEANYNGFERQGIPLGYYFLGTACSDAEVDAEVAFVRDKLTGKRVDAPIWYDVEVVEGDYYNVLTNSQRTSLALRFMRGIENLGYKAGLYTGLWYTNYLDMGRILPEFPVWIAQYNWECQYPQAKLWQYTSSGNIDGIIWGGQDLSEPLDDAWWNAIISGDDVQKPTPTPEPEPKPEPSKGGYEVNLPNLWIGCESQYVACLQGLLQYHGYSLTYCGGTDGVFGSGTEYAVKAFQKTHDLEIDGVVGEQTWGKLFEKS